MEPYNSLTDPHLYGYFSNEQRKKDLKKAGLIGKQGEVITEATYRLNAIMAEKGTRRFNAEDDRKLDENGRQLRRLPKVNMPSEDFCKEKDHKYRSASCHRYFNASKSCSYDRIKSAPDYAIKKPSYTTYQEVMAGVKNKYPWSSSSPYLWPLPTPSNDLIRVNISGERQRCEGYLTYSALPAIRRSQDDHLGNRRRDETLRLSGTLHIFPTPSANLSSTGNSNSIFQRHHGNSNNNNFTSCNNNNSYFSSSAKNNLGAISNSLMRKRCLVTMHYYGDPIRLSELWSYRKDEITIEQQHCGGNTLVVFRGKLAPGSDFTFPSMRRRDFPFSLTIYIEHQQNTRISVCCEAKHRKGIRLGGNNGCFGLVDVENPGYCESCTEAKRRKKLERKARKQKKMKGTFRKEDEDDEDESKKSQEDDDDDDDDNEKKQKRKKLKLNNRKDDDNYEDDFENESDKEKSVPTSVKQEETKKETEALEKSPNSVRSSESERSKSYKDKIHKKKTQTFEREDKMEIEDVSISARIKESKQGSEKAKTTKNKHKKESEASSAGKSTRFNSSEQRSESRDKKSQRRKTPRSIELPLVSAENKSMTSAKDENESENTNNRKNSSRCDSSASRRSSKSNKESSHFSPLEDAAENSEILQENENETTPREGRRSVITEAGESEIEKSEVEGPADGARYQSRMSGKTETICSTGENMDVDERNESEIANDKDDGKTDNEDGNMDDEDRIMNDEDRIMNDEDRIMNDDEENQEVTEETNEDDMDNERPSSGADRRKKNEEYEVKLREAAMECVADVYRSLEKSMKEEIDLENPDEEA